MARRAQAYRSGPGGIEVISGKAFAISTASQFRPAATASKPALPISPANDAETANSTS